MGEKIIEYSNNSIMEATVHYKETMMIFIDQSWIEVHKMLYKNNTIVLAHVLWFDRN